MEEPVRGTVKEQEKHELGTVGSVHWLAVRDSGIVFSLHQAQLCHSIAMIMLFRKPLYIPLSLSQHLAFPKARLL